MCFVCKTIAQRGGYIDMTILMGTNAAKSLEAFLAFLRGDKAGVVWFQCGAVWT